MEKKVDVYGKTKAGTKTHRTISIYNTTTKADAKKEAEKLAQRQKAFGLTKNKTKVR